MNNKEILYLTFYSDDLDEEVTIIKFFHILLETLWLQQESFNSKRPFGNSGWDGDLIKCLVQNKVIEGIIDENGYLGSYPNQSIVDEKVLELLNEIFKK